MSLNQIASQIDDNDQNKTIKPMTEREIQDRLYWDLQGSQVLICPNYTPANWWECDMYSLTKAGYATEHEIKLTKADFEKDREKSWDKVIARKDRSGYDRVFTYKHDLLAKRDTSGPSRFWYVVARDIADKITVPEWAGLKVVERGTKYWNSQISLTIVKPAPQLHREKASAKTIQHLQGVFFYRYWKMRLVTRDLPDMDLSESADLAINLNDIEESAAKGEPVHA